MKDQELFRILCNYLPYGLNFENNGEIFLLLQLNVYYDQKPMQVEGYSETLQEIRAIFLEGCKPILHSLSDLTKEIEHNGEKFVPIEKLIQLAECGHDKSIITLVDNGSIDAEACIELTYGLISKLIEWHFDVFGLIPQGKAIDINTLEL